MHRVALALRLVVPDIEADRWFGSLASIGSRHVIVDAEDGKDSRIQIRISVSSPSADVHGQAI
jgi:hypothetical protein